MGQKTEKDMFINRCNKIIFESCLVVFGVFTPSLRRLIAGRGEDSVGFRTRRLNISKKIKFVFNHC